jgi:hypothetical protein
MRAMHIPIEEQPRADLVIAAERLWPIEPAGAQLAGRARSGEDTLFSSLLAFDPSLLLRLRLSEVCTEEAMVRVRLCGALTGEQRHQLALADLLAYGRQHAFSFELDTRGLSFSLGNAPLGGDERLV